MPRKLPLMFAGVLLIAVAAFAASCGDDEDGGGNTPVATAARTEPAGKIDISGVPELADGVLNIGSDIAYAPIEYVDEATNKPAGLDVDIASAMAEKLGVRAEFTNGSFDGLIPALQAERHDAVMSAMWVNEERLQQVDFVKYFLAGAGIVVPNGNPDNVKGPDDLCGKTVATQEGTTHVDFLTAQSEKCTAAGKGAITITRFNTDPEAVLALVSGQADAEMADYPVAANSARERDSDLDLVETQVEPLPYGIAVRKQSTALRDALQAAFEAIRDDGTYDSILEKWQLQAGALTD
jgi:polar amino acid transport system substrate-binding protein